MNSGQASTSVEVTPQSTVALSDKSDISSQINKMISDLDGQIMNQNQAQAVQNKPEIAVTEKIVAAMTGAKVPETEIKTNQTAYPANSGESFISMMTAKSSDSILFSGQNSTQVTLMQQSLAPQIIQAIRQVPLAMQPQEIQEMTLRLHPQELGKLDLSMRMENGQLYVTIKASELLTGQMLQNQMQDLKQHFRDAGIDCAGLEMDFGDQTQEQSFSEAFQDGRHKLMRQEIESQTMMSADDFSLEDENPGTIGINNVNVKA
jgi:flagellar hook-length control protein FliK